MTTIVVNYHPIKCDLYTIARLTTSRQTTFFVKLIINACLTPWLPLLCIISMLTRWQVDEVTNTQIIFHFDQLTLFNLLLHAIIYFLHFFYTTGKSAFDWSWSRSYLMNFDLACVVARALDLFIDKHISTDGKNVLCIGRVQISVHSFKIMLCFIDSIQISRLCRIG